uniref:Uncharacterized protein n=1 Tax=Musa acuminata subsp. malaccensis TaxID=214687 RepID=A0A804J5E2_MUSAM
MGDYQNEIYCDILPIDVAHILLGQPWLYNVDITNHGRENTCLSIQRQLSRDQ